MASRTPSPAGAPDGRAGWLLLLPVALAVLAYARALHGEFQFDDFSAVEHNRALASPGALLRSFPAALLGAGRPLTDLTFALNRAAGGLDPFGYHLVNLAIHLAATWLAWRLAREVLELAGAARARGTAVAVAGIFALHPLQSQAVSYVAQRAESLSAALALAALLLLLSAERRWPTARGVAAWAGAAVAFALALSAKPVAVVLPVAWLLLAAAVPGPRGRERLVGWRTRLVMLAPLAVLAAVHAAATLRALRGHADAGFDVPGLGRGSHLATQGKVVATYLRLLLWPAGQNVDWAYPLSPGLSDPWALAAGLLLAGLGAASLLALWRSRGAAGEGAAVARVAGFGLLWFFLFLAPTSLVPVADLLMEHRLYLASWGIFAAAAATAGHGLSRAAGERRTPAILLTAAIWAALATALVRRNAVWETRVALWSDAAARAPESWRARLNLGHARLQAGDPAGAIGECLRALALAGSGDPGVERRIRNALGTALFRSGRAAEAVAQFQRSVELGPSDVESLSGLAVAAWRAGDAAAAERQASRALAIRPGETAALQVVGAVRLARGDLAGAHEAFARAVREDPDDGQQWFNLGAVAARMGRQGEACDAWSRVSRARAAPQVAEQARRARAALSCR